MSSNNDRSGPSGLRLAGGQLLEARRAAMSAAGPHRLEAVRTLDEVLYVNDSRATFLDASIESLGAMDRRVVWIAGTWSEDMAEGQVQMLLQERVSALVLFGPLVEGGEDSLPQHCFRADDLRTAVFAARELAAPGQAVLFSPACPSGHGFANYEERGAAFKQAVRDL
jgi:UDP-N-acetylmuramoylalanine--D-glutamate ligase